MPTDENKNESPDIFGMLKELSGSSTSFLQEAVSGIIETQSESDMSATARQRRQEILAAALEVFARKGFSGSRTKEIATSAGVSEALLFKYFPTKKHILQGIMRPFFEAVAKPLFMAPVGKIIETAPTRTLEETIFLIMLDRIQMFRKNERFATTVLMELVRQPDMMDIMKQLIMPTILSTLEPLFDGARQRGEIRANLDSRLLTRNMLSTIFGTVMLLNLFGSHFSRKDLEADIRDTVAVFVRGIQA